jgi:hypothetical protein
MPRKTTKIHMPDLSDNASEGFVLPMPPEYLQAMQDNEQLLTVLRTLFTHARPTPIEAALSKGDVVVLDEIE